MDPTYIRDTILLRLAEVAPETAEAGLEPDTDIRAALALDDDDFRGYVDDLADELDVEIPPSDFSHLRTIGEAVRYLSQRTA